MRSFGLIDPAARAAEHLADMRQREREQAALETITGDARSRAALARLDAEDLARERALRLTFGSRFATFTRAHQRELLAR